MGTVVPSGSVVVVGAAVRLICCWPDAATAAKRSSTLTAAAAFKVALHWRSMIRIMVLASRRRSLLDLILNSSFIPRAGDTQTFGPRTASEQRLPSLRFVDDKFACIHQQHHEHAAGEDVVRRNLALVVGVPHERPATLVGGVDLQIGGLQ